MPCLPSRRRRGRALHISGAATGCSTGFSGGRSAVASPGSPGGVRSAIPTVVVFRLRVLFFLLFYLIYPVVETFRLSFFDKTGTFSSGWALTSGPSVIPGSKQEVLNNILWLAIVLDVVFVGVGLVIVRVADRLWWGGFAKSLVFMPMAISFVSASVIWKFVQNLTHLLRRSDRGPQCHGDVARPATRGVADHSVLEFHSADGHPDLHPDRLCHGHPCSSAARRAVGDVEAAHIDVPTAFKSSSTSWSRRSAGPSSWSGRRSPSSP